MIVDIFNEVYTKLKTTITTATVLVEYPESDPLFPCIIIEEVSNITDTETVDTSGETNNLIAFDVNIFSDAINKRTICRNLRNAVDAIMADEYGMERLDTGAIPNYGNLNIYRYNIRYNCKVNQNKVINRR